MTCGSHCCRGRPTTLAAPAKPRHPAIDALMDVRGWLTVGFLVALAVLS